MQKLIDEVASLVAKYSDEHDLAPKVADALRAALADGMEIPIGAIRPDPSRYVMYPLHVAADGAFSIASAVWNVGQGTPVHGHETWGVVGIYSGQEREVAYEKPRISDVPLVVKGERVWHPGEVTVCCTTDDDVHQVSCAGNVPVIGIHVYGGDIGTLRRRSYIPETGEVNWFISNWASMD